MVPVNETDVPQLDYLPVHPNLREESEDATDVRTEGDGGRGDEVMSCSGAPGRRRCAKFYNHSGLWYRFNRGNDRTERYLCKSGGGCRVTLNIDRESRVPRLSDPSHTVEKFGESHTRPPPDEMMDTFVDF